MNFCQVLLVVTWFCLPLLCLSPVTIAQDIGAPCVFPFIFKNIRYSGCTTVDDPDGKLWCSTKTDNQDRHILQMGHWKHCTVTIRGESKTDCKTYPESKVGDCMNIQKCPLLNAILERVKRGQGNNNELDILRNSVCSHSESGLGVCCTRTTTSITPKPTPRPTLRPTPRTTTTNPTRISPSKRCGTSYIPDRIVGGTNAQLTAWPWMVIFQGKEKLSSNNNNPSCNDNNPSCSGWASIGECQSNPSFMNTNCKKSCNRCPSSNSGPGFWFCGGVLITEQYVLTAAHCFKNNIKLEYARIGEFDLSTNPDRGSGHTAPTPQDIDIERVIIHPNYKSPCRRCNDIALVKLAKPAQLHTFFVEPVCLPSNPQRDMRFSVSEFQGKLSWATGWGVTDAADIFATSKATILQQVNLTIQELNFCHEQKRKYPDGRMILCAGQGDGRDVCRADSGGPIMLSDSTLTKWYVVGITSFGSTVCGDRSAQGIFTSVHYYMDWINRIIA